MGTFLGFFDPGDSVSYSNVQTGDSTITVHYNVATDNIWGTPVIAIYIDGVKEGTLNITGMSSWSTFITVQHSISITSGFHTITLINEGTSGVNIDWFEGLAGGAYSSSSASSSSGSSTNALVQSWFSSEEKPQWGNWWDDDQHPLYTLSQQPDFSLVSGGGGGDTITVESGTTYQAINGIGWSLEESTVYNLMRMSAGKREEVIRRLVEPGRSDGAAIDMMRICIGTSDFTARTFYTHDDMPPGQTDPILASFSIQKDIDYGIIEVLQAAMTYNPELRLIASPWSPPGWMKDNDSLIQGNIRNEYIPVYAEYLRRFVQAYQDQGIPIYAMTMQNEPGIVVPYISCGMTSEQQKQLATNLRAELDTHGLNTRLLVWDFNVEIPSDISLNYVRNILNDPAAYNSVIGTAFHGYYGDVSAFSVLHNEYPNKEIWFTEKSEWGLGGMSTIISYFKNWSTSYCGWVTMLDGNKQPEQWSGTPAVSMLVQDPINYDNYWATDQFYLIGQFSKFIDHGALRIESSGFITGMEHVAFINPDGEKVLIVLNMSGGNRTFTISYDGFSQSTMIPDGVMATYTW